MSYIKDNQTVGKNFVRHIEQDINSLITDKKRKLEIELMGEKIDLLTSLVYEYPNLISKVMDTDDEIINWTFPDVNYDLISAVWNLYSCLYKTTASSLRNAFEMSFLSLYFQLRQNEDFAKGINAYNIYFEQWDRGDRPTPNWGEMKSIVKKNLNIQQYNGSRNCDIIEEVYNWYSYLCNFTHGRPFDNSVDNVINKPTNHMNIGVGFSVQNFDRFATYVTQTISWIAVFWSLSFPTIIKASEIEKYISLFEGDRANDVSTYITTEIL